MSDFAKYIKPDVRTNEVTSRVNSKDFRNTDYQSHRQVTAAEVKAQPSVPTIDLYDSGVVIRKEGSRRTLDYPGGRQEIFYGNRKVSETQFEADGRTPRKHRTFFAESVGGGVAMETSFIDGKKIGHIEYSSTGLKHRESILHLDGSETKKNYDGLGLLKLSQTYKDGKLTATEAYRAGIPTEIVEYDDKNNPTAKTKFNRAGKPLQTVDYKDGEEVASTMYKYKDGVKVSEEKWNLGPTLSLLNSKTFAKSGKVLTETSPNQYGGFTTVGGFTSAGDFSIATDKWNHPRKIITKNGDERDIVCDPKGNVLQYSDSRGKYSSRDGKTWYKPGNKPPAEPDWKGSITVDGDHCVHEKSAGGTSHLWHADGRHEVKYTDGTQLDFDTRRRVTRLVDKEGNETKLKYVDNQRLASEITDSRGCYVRDGLTSTWYKNGDFSKSKPDWRGSIETSAEGAVRETDFNTNKITTWLMDGTRRESTPRLPIDRFSDHALAIFDKLDKDKNGYLSAKELAGALQDSRSTGADAQVIAALYKNLGKLKDLSSDEIGWDSDISRKDIERFGDLATKKVTDKDSLTAKEKELVNSLEFDLENTAKMQKRNAMNFYKLWPEHLEGSLEPQDMTQGRIGNCYFHAAVAGLVKNNPQAIKDMIRDNDNGTFTVTFPGDPNRPVTVPVPSDGEMGLYGKSSNGYWFSVLEKAFGEYKQNPQWFRTSHTSIEGSDGGGFSSDVIKLLTKENARHHNVEDTDSQREALKAALNAKKIVTVSSLGASDTERTKDGYVASHAYTVLAFDSDTGLITIRNPHNKTEKDGTWTLPWTELQRNFRYFSFEKQ